MSVFTEGAEKKCSCPDSDLRYRRSINPKSTFSIVLFVIVALLFIILSTLALFIFVEMIVDLFENDRNYNNESLVKVPNAGGWKRVGDTEQEVYVFSAFLDDRNSSRNAVTVVGASTDPTDLELWCRFFWVDNKPLEITTEGIVKSWNNTNESDVKGIIVTCPLPEDVKKAPSTVSIIAGPSAQPRNYLSIVDNTKEPTGNKYGACVHPLLNSTTADRIMEFMEVNLMIGVHHFIFYNYSIDPALDCVLQNYSNRGLATVLPWKLQSVSEVDVTTTSMYKELSVIALNDCTFRSRTLFSLIFSIGVDEYLMPMTNVTLPKTIESIDNGTNSTIGCYNFQRLLLEEDLRHQQNGSEEVPREAYGYRPEAVVSIDDIGNYELLGGFDSLSVDPNDVSLLLSRDADIGFFIDHARVTNSSLIDDGLLLNIGESETSFINLHRAMCGNSSEPITEIVN